MMTNSNKKPTNCLSLTAEMSVLGVDTNASSHPVGSKSFDSTALELNVGAASANMQTLFSKLPGYKILHN